MRTMMLIGLTVMLSACESMMLTNNPAIPDTSRTAVVHDVRITLTDIAPTDLRVNVGDEIRFINERSNPVRVILIEAGKSIACTKGFNGHIDQEARIKPGQYASFCFNKTGPVRYMAREQTSVTGGEQVLSAQIQVQGGAVQATSGREDFVLPSRSRGELSLAPER